MKYRCIDQLQTKANTIASLCRLLSVSRAGYYAARLRSRRPTKLCSTTLHLQAACTASGRSYGSRRRRMAVHAKGLAVGRYRIRRLMRINGLRPAWKRQFIHTTDSKHDLPIAANILNRQFSPATANAAWVSDITYIRTRSGWLYLGGSDGLVLAQDRRLGDGTEHARRVGLRGLADGDYATATVCRTDRAFRPWQPVRQCGPSSPAGPTWLAGQHEPQGPLLGQRREGAFLP